MKLLQSETPSIPQRDLLMKTQMTSKLTSIRSMPPEKSTKPIIKSQTLTKSACTKGKGCLMMMNQTSMLTFSMMIRRMESKLTLLQKPSPSQSIIPNIVLSSSMYRSKRSDELSKRLPRMLHTLYLEVKFNRLLSLRIQR